MEITLHCIFYFLCNNKLICGIGLRAFVSMDSVFDSWKWSPNCTRKCHLNVNCSMFILLIISLQHDLPYILQHLLIAKWTKFWTAGDWWGITFCSFMFNVLFLGLLTDWNIVMTWCYPIWCCKRGWVFKTQSPSDICILSKWTVMLEQFLKNGNCTKS